MRSSTLVLILSLMFAGVASAQQTTGTITGRAIDAQGLAVPGATVTLTGPQGSKTATTDGQGRFRLSLTPGHYTVSIKGRKTTIGRFGPFEVDVVSGKMTKVQWDCDSGIR